MFEQARHLINFYLTSSAIYSFIMRLHPYYIDKYCETKTYFWQLLLFSKTSRFVFKIKTNTRSANIANGTLVQSVF